MTHILLQLLLSFTLSGVEPPSDALKSPVLLIKSGTQTGTGFLAGNRGETLFIVTARHVIEDPGQIDIRFYNKTKTTSRVLYSSDFWDIAVITCQRPVGFIIPRSFSPASKPYTSREEVITVGHPVGNDWLVYPDDKIIDIQHRETPNFFIITTKGIAHGSSGGPVLNASQELIGMVLKKDAIKAECLAKDQIMNVLKLWHVPTNLMIPPPPFYIDSLAGEMILVKEGNFTMGQPGPGIGGGGNNDNEEPPHQVNVPKFYLGKYEVTQGQWKAIMEENPSYFKKGDNYPVEQVSWEDVQEFIKKLNQRSEYTYRLPTEIEWEYAAGGGNQSHTAYGGTDSESNLYLYGNYWESGDSDKDKHEKTSPVGFFKENAIGLHDVSGNVWEWCEDGYYNTYTRAPDADSVWLPPKGSLRVVRGGSWRETPYRLRVNYRDVSWPDVRSLDFGFRLARTP